MELMERIKKPLIILMIAAIFAAFSFLFAAPAFSSTETHAADIAAIDEKIQTVLQLTGTSAVASVAVSAIPGDTATPVAEKLADFSEYFLIILCVLYVEKYLLTLMGVGAFKIMIPVAVLVMGVGFTGLFPKASERMRRIGFRLIALGIGLYLSVPAGLRVSDMIYSTYEENIQATVSTSDELSTATSQFAGTEDETVVDKILASISETVEGLTGKAVRILKQFTETLAVLIVTSCVIPLLVILFILILIRVFTGVDPASYIPVGVGVGKHGRMKVKPKRSPL